MDKEAKRLYQHNYYLKNKNRLLSENKARITKIYCPICKFEFNSTNKKKHYASMKHYNIKTSKILKESTIVIHQQPKTITCH